MDMLHLFKVGRGKTSTEKEERHPHKPPVGSFQVLHSRKQELFDDFNRKYVFQPHPWRLTCNISSWRFGSDHFPFFSWVMPVGEPCRSPGFFHDFQGTCWLLPGSSWPRRLEDCKILIYLDLWGRAWDCLDFGHQSHVAQAWETPMKTLGFYLQKTNDNHYFLNRGYIFKCLFLHCHVPNKAISSKLSLSKTNNFQ